MLETGRLQREPPWYRVVGAIPPTTTLVRTPPVQLQEKKTRKSAHKPSRMFQPHYIVYPEDELRRQFFQDHPWELARPRILVENDGKDFMRYDWSKMRQPGKMLDGESVVQRQMWLMENQGKSKIEAYDIARKEFYDLRMREDIERRVTAEEALSVGAKFGKSYMDIGIELEQKALERWKEKAIALLQLKRGRQAAFSGTSEEDDGAATPVPEAILDVGEEGVAAPAAEAVAV